MFNKWLLVFAFTTAAFAAGWVFHFIPWLLSLDTTYMSHAVVAGFFASSLYLGWEIKRNDYVDDEKYEWIRETFNWVGLFGTMWFITFYFQKAHLGTIDIADIASFKKAFLQIADGMSVALIPTLFGMLAERALSVQLRVTK